jgi:hypothetical protein
MNLLLRKDTVNVEEMVKDIHMNIKQINRKNKIVEPENIDMEGYIPSPKEKPVYLPTSPEYAPDGSPVYNPTSPVYVPTTPEYAADGSPVYIPTSPVYVPTTPEYAADGSPVYIPTSPVYNQTSPEYNPDGSPIYNQNSPEYAKGSPAYIDSEQKGGMNDYSIGQTVSLRGYVTGGGSRKMFGRYKILHQSLLQL